MEYLSKEGQDIIDISIQNFGDIESGLFSIIASNQNVGLNTNIQPNQKFTLNNENIGLITEKTYFANRSFVINNADETQLSTSIGEFGSGFDNSFNNKTI